jgi:hypothetical protein
MLTMSVHAAGEAPANTTSAAEADARARGAADEACRAATVAATSPPRELPAPPAHAAGDLAHDAAASPPPPEAPEALLGRRARRDCGGVLYEGVVTRVRFTQAYGTLWRVHYPEDDDSEELTWRELRDALLPAAPAAAVAPVAAAVGDDDAVALPPRRSALPVAPPVAHVLRPRAPGAMLARTQAQRSSSGGGSHAMRSQPPPARPLRRQYTGVYPRPSGYFSVQCRAQGRRHSFVTSGKAADAARAYDDIVRAHFPRPHVVNFPRPGTDEVQAVRKHADAATPRPAARQPRAAARRGSRAVKLTANAHAARAGRGAAPPAPAPAAREKRAAAAQHAATAPHGGAEQQLHRRDAAAAPTKQYKGITRVATGMFRAQCCVNANNVSLGFHDTAEAAARAYDAAVRAQGRRVVNFPRAGTDEVQAVANQIDHVTLQLAQQQSSQRAAAKPARMGPASRHPPSARAKTAQRAGGSNAAGAAQPPAPPLARGRYTVRQRAAVGGAGAAAEDNKQAPHHEAGDGAAPPPVAQAPICFRGVRCIPSAGGVNFTADLYISDKRSVVSVGRHFRTAEDAARAIDAEARRRGMLRLLNFPATDAERAAVARYMENPSAAAAATRRAEQQANAAAAAKKCVRPLKKRREDAHDDAGGGGGGAGASGAAAPVSRAKRARTEDACGAAAPLGAQHETVALPVSSHIAAAAPPAAPAANQAGAGGAAGAQHSDAAVSQLASFLRGITPPLSNLPTVLDAARRSGITLAHLASLAASSPSASQQLALDIATSALRIGAPGDQLAFALALAPLAQGISTGGAAD